METRLALAACVVLGSALCGKAAADAVRRRARALDSLADGLRTLRVHMLGMVEPLQCALEHSECPVLTLGGEGMKEGRSAGDVWRDRRRTASRRGGPAEALTEADLRVLDALFERLGQCCREKQEALLDSAIQSVERLLDSARKRAAEADRLYLSLGLLVGLMLALIVI